MLNSFYFHTDFFKFYVHLLKKKNISINKASNLMLNELKIISENKIIVPTFNYQFPQKKVFNYFYDRSEVGHFTEYFRRKYLTNRTYVPLLSDCSSFKIPKKIKSKIDILSEDSIFGQMAESKSNIVFFGSNFIPTYIMYIENHFFKFPKYRATKTFVGKIKIGKNSKKISVNYNCRPIKIKFEYDLKKIESHLKKKKILKEKISPSGFKYKIMRSEDFLEYSLKKLKQDEYFFLKKETSNLIKKILLKENSVTNYI